MFAVMTIVAIALVAYRWWPIDGFDGMFDLSPGNTTWANSFTDDGFRAVRVGMKRDEVLALLGPPLEAGTSSSGYRVDSWTQSVTHLDRHRTRIITYKGGTVINKRASVNY
jgi:outer membrane protein assembly factor BamE (lipoprotein component of BamABCDE complex)